jgi:hypothetical protein
MPNLLVSFLALVAVLICFFVTLRLNLRWIYRFVDHSQVRSRTQLPAEFELPRYFRLDPKGKADMSVRWPGWDGWYFFVAPTDPSVPFQMIRASLMTGLYGLDGVDNYEKVKLRLSTFETVESLSLIPTLEISVGSGAGVRRNYFSQHYLPRRTDLLMKVDELDVTISGQGIENDELRQPHGRIRGKWPNYHFHFLDPEAEIDLSLDYKAGDIIWWADLPCVFTYFASFGEFSGSITYHRGTRVGDPRQLPKNPEVYPVQGRGCFEHGCARKPFDFDKLWRAVRLLQNIAPSFRPVRYHYELMAGNPVFHGGFMKARGFGIDFRNRGGLYWKGSYREIKSIRVDYLNEPEPDRVELHCSTRPPVTFPRKWKVEAMTDVGPLIYVGTRAWPPAAIAGSMMYYHFDYQGTYQGEILSGRGYGEYLHL